MAAERNWTHRTKHAPWGAGTGAGDIVVVGLDLSAAAFVWAFADTPSGSADITLTNAAVSVQGVSAVWDPNFVHPRSGEVVGATIITPHISEATLEGLTFSGTSPLVLYHDLLVTPSGGVQRPVLYGTLTVHQGVGD
jgi:hypothetical protein